jgi:hypothetical protein
MCKGAPARVNERGANFIGPARRHRRRYVPKRQSRRFPPGATKAETISTLTQPATIQATAVRQHQH